MQKKFGQIRLVVWFPAPEGGRFEFWTDTNKDGADFIKNNRKAIEMLQRFTTAAEKRLQAHEEPPASAAVDPSDGARESSPMREKESFVAGARPVATEGDTNNG
jgi:hypothetical protein